MAKFSTKGLTEEEKREVNKKKGRASKRKGATNELAIAHKMQEYGFTDAKRTAQHSGKGGGKADIEGVPYLHIEVKAQERLNVHDAYDQALRDVKDKNGIDIPVVFHKQNNRGWKATLSLDDFISIWKELDNDKKYKLAELLSVRRNNG